MPVLIEAMRPAHWVKNGFVMAPLLFSGHFVLAMSWLQCGMVTLAFCLLSSGVYLFNDVCDRNRDRAHPSKCRRPVASGRLSWPAALTFGALLLLAGLALVVVEASTWPGPRKWGVLVWSLAYLAVNFLYSFWLKQHPIVDVIAIGMGFVFRAMAGAAAILVPVSPWLVVCTFTLCLFIALSKRRSELMELDPQTAALSRPVNHIYTLPNVEFMLIISTAMAVVTYCLYCLSPRTIDRFGSAHMVWTIPLVVYGVFRYNLLAKKSQSDPVTVIVRDRGMWLVVAAYVVLTLLIRLYGGREGFNLILE